LDNRTLEPHHLGGGRLTEIEYKAKKWDFLTLTHPEW